MYKKSMIENIYDNYPLFDLDVYKKENKDLLFKKDEEYIQHFNNIGYQQNRKYNNNIYNIYNKYHLGDNIFNIIFFNKILPYLKKNNIKIHYYCLKQYHKQVEEFIFDKEYIILKELTDKIIGMEAWINNENLIKRYELQNKIGFDRYYMYFFNILCKKMRIPYCIQDLKYTDDDLLLRLDKLKNENKDILNNLDILIINSEPLSGQYKYNKKDWYNFILYLTSKFKIITTLKIDENIPCTMDLGFSCKDIAAISTNVKYIISINTGPFVGCYNEYTLKQVLKIYIFVDNLKFEHYKISVHQNILDLYKFF